MLRYNKDTRLGTFSDLELSLFFTTFERDRDRERKGRIQVSGLRGVELESGERSAAKFVCNSPRIAEIHRIWKEINDFAIFLNFLYSPLLYNA